MKKKLLTLLLAVAASVGTISAENGTCGDNLTWNLTDGVLTISGTGEMTNFSSETDAPWYAYREEIQSLNISEKVTSIGDYAFQNYSKLNAVTIGSSVTSIGENAFVDCSNLSSITCKAITPPTFECGGAPLPPNNAPAHKKVQISLGCPFDGVDKSIPVYVPCFSVKNYQSSWDWSEFTNIIAEGEGTAVVVSGICGAQGDNLTWELSCNGVLTITGSGAMRDGLSNGNGIPWYEYRDYILSIDIKDGVTNIGQYAFYNCNNVTNIKIPNSVTYIGYCAFYYCSSLISINIPNDITYFAYNTFAGCSSLTSIEIPNNVASIGQYAFNGCTSLTSIEIPNNVTSIGEGAFFNCTSLTSIEIPNNVASIGIYAFSNCSNLKFLKIQNTTPPTLEATNIFNNCSNLSDIFVPCGSLDSYKSSWNSYSNKIKYESSPYKLEVSTADNTAGYVSFPSTPTICENQIKAIPYDGYRFKQWSDGVEENPRTITLTEDITLSAEFEFFASGTCGAQGDNLTWTLDNNGVLTISGTGEMKDFCGPVVPYWAPSRRSTKEISVIGMCPGLNTPWDSYRTSIKKIIIEEGVTSISDYAFMDCTALTEVTLIPNSITSIGYGAFAYCSSLEEITFANTLPPTIDDDCFFDCSCTFNVPCGAKRAYAFVLGVEENRITEVSLDCEPTPCIVANGNCGAQENNITWTLDCDGVLTISGIGEMGDFCGLPISGAGDPQRPDAPNRRKAIIGSSTPWEIYKEKIREVTISEGVTNISPCSFSNCTALTSVSVPNSVTSIGDDAFFGCSSLTSIEIPNNVTSIGEGALSNCSSLIEINVSSDNSNYSSQDGVLFNKDKTILFQYPGGKQGDYSIPTSVTSIEAYGFYGCSGLTSLTCEAVTPISLGYSVFYNMNKSIPVYVHASSISAYKVANQWKDFTNIQPIPGEKLKITWQNEDGTMLTEDMLEYGVMPEYTGETPEKPATQQYSYTFNGWDPEVVAVIEDAIYTATFEATLNKYLVKFLNDDNIELQSGEIEYGVVPTYTGETPTKPSDAQYTYTFAGWDAEVIAVTGEATYTATFDAALNKYIVQFLNYDNTELQSGEVEYGVVPSYTGGTPTKPADLQYTYTFAGWDAEIVAVTGEATYTAVFESILNKVNITWQDEDGNPILEEQVEYGTTPVFSGEIPTKPSDSEYSYEFVGWLPKIKPATEDARYTTYFDRHKLVSDKVYTVNINGENCSLHISNEVPAGTTLQVEAVADECFQFQKWSDNETANPRTINVTEDANLTAEFNKLRYTITGKNDTEGGQVNVEEVNP